MSEKQQKKSVLHIIPKPDLPEGEEVVISGIAGRFPESRNIVELEKNLMAKKDLITDDQRRWILDHPDIPNRTGKVPDVSKFDATFFGVHFKQAHTMDPMCRMLLEHAYEAIIDAGVNPIQLRGRRTAVVIGSCFSETEQVWFYEKLTANGFGLMGCSRAMLANRISFCLGLHGPSFAMDTACSSSLSALENACRLIWSGQCDDALVGGCNLCLHPCTSLQFSRLGVLSADGKSKSFDADANGYARGEAISVLYLQKQKDAKRVYATVVHGKANCDGYKPEGITFPSSDLQARLLEEFYKECRVSPESLAYIEAHGTGTRVGDPEEINAIEKVFLPHRKEPLLIGSVKSNLGHTEPASGMCSVAKVIIGMETGLIPPNINYTHPRKDTKSLEDGSMKVVVEPMPWRGGYVGISSFGFGGANVHILLKSNPKEKVNKGLPSDDLPRLVTVSGRTEEAVDALLRSVEKSRDVEYMRLLHDIHVDNIIGHTYRGYTVVHPKEPSEHPTTEIQNCSDVKRPIWFVFSGMGSQWAGMGESLMKFPIFAKAIQKCDAVLKPRGVDIINIITNKEKETFDSILNSFVGIAAVQVGLVDLLKSVGIEPDNIIGHSVGELGCAYADGCFTAEQMVLSAYSRGLASLETKLIRGSMAAVGLGYQSIKNLCPPEIEIACHNSAESCTISGPAEPLKEFVAKLQAKKIFAKEVPCCNIAYHSRYIAAAGPKLLEYLKELVPEPKARSGKWLSTSVPRKEWTTNLAKFSSAEYHTNNLLGAVLFEETAALIPSNAISIEIAPHGLLQAILKRSLSSNVIKVPLMQRGHKDNAAFFLQALGKLYNVGVQSTISELFPPIEFPVSRSTPMISPHIRWEHSADWYVMTCVKRDKLVSGERQVEISFQEEGSEFIAGHVIDGRNLFPATGYLHMVWDTYSMMHGKVEAGMSVVFENVKFERATNMPKQGKVVFMIMIHKGTGRFEISESGVPVVTGMIRALTNLTTEKIPSEFSPQIDDEEVLTSKDIYKEFRLRGYQYSGLFRGLKSASLNANKGHVVWTKNWVAFMDNMLQLSILKCKNRYLYVPTSIQKLVIDINVHSDLVDKLPVDKQELPIYQYCEWDTIVCGGVEIRGIKATDISRRKLTADPVLEEYRFIAHRDREDVSLKTMLILSSHLALENRLMANVKTIEAIDEEDDICEEDLLTPQLVQILSDLPLVIALPTLAAPTDRYNNEKLPGITIVEPKKIPTDGSVFIAMGYNLSTKNKEECLKLLRFSLIEGGYILAREKAINEQTSSYFDKHGFSIILEKMYKTETVLLLKKQGQFLFRPNVIHVSSWKFEWLEKIREILQAEMEGKHRLPTKLILVAEGDPESGLLGMSNCLRREPGGDIVRTVLIQNPNAPKFSLDNPLYADQLKLDLAVNILGPDNVWGSYRHLPLPPMQLSPVNHAYVDQLVRADMSSLTWVRGPFGQGYKHKDLVHIAYAPLNFKDIMMASGKMSLSIAGGNRSFPSSSVGFEYSGVDENGQNVMGITQNRALSNLCIAEPLLQWKVPKRWTLEDAATVPCVYATAIYALHYYAQMKKGDKVLIHAGSGGVGQAAIHLALHEGCEVFTTVGTPEKRQFIKDLFPSIDDDHIGNSRDTSFEQMVMKQTKGRGVDIVLNSLAEEKLQASVRCLAQGGRFLEIGKFDLAVNNALGMQIFLKEVSFHGVMLDFMIAGSMKAKAELQKLFATYLESGVIKPLTRKTFSRHEVEAAFRYMAAGKHIGKVLIKLHEDNAVWNEPILAYPRYHCLSDRSYVIFGGLGGLGLEVTDWLVQRGATNIVLISRGGIKEGYQRLRIETWKSFGVKVSVLSGLDASKDEDCEYILKSADKLAPVDAIFNLAVVLKDSTCVNQTIETFEESLKPKAFITKKLDQHSRRLCPQLRHFVVFSSVSCGRGNAGQTNYGMANSVMERTCEKRVREGLPGLAIQWGAVGEVGIIANMLEENKEVVIGGTLQQKVSSCLQALDKFLEQSRPIVCSMVVAEKRVGDSDTDIVGSILNIMGLKDLKSVSQTLSLAELGMDSMMAVEIKQTLERDFGVYLTAQDMRTLNFAKLVEMSEKESKRGGIRVVKPEEVAESVSGIKLFIDAQIMGMISDTCIEYPGNCQESPPPTFIFPGVGGNSCIFDNIAVKLKYPATCFQLPYDIDQSVVSLANAFLPHILKKSKENGKEIVLVGYSFGSLIAIEVARLLEAEGLSCRIVLIDGSPLYLKKAMEIHIPSKTDEELQAFALLNLMDYLSPSCSSAFSEELVKCSTLEEEVDAFLSHVHSGIKLLDINDQKRVCLAIINRFVAVKNYNCSTLPPLKYAITLLKATVPAIHLAEDDYGLSTVTSGKIDVHNVQGNHITLLDDDKLATAINGEDIDDDEKRYEGGIESDYVEH